MMNHTVQSPYLLTSVATYLPPSRLRLRLIPPGQFKQIKPVSATYQSFCDPSTLRLMQITLHRIHAAPPCHTDPA